MFAATMMQTFADYSKKRSNCCGWSPKNISELLKLCPSDPPSSPCQVRTYTLTLISNVFYHSFLELSKQFDYVSVADLRELQVRFSRKKMWFEHQELTSQDELHFISKVTRLIAFDRMPQVKKSLPRFMEPPRSDDQDEYDEEEDGGDGDTVVEDDDEEDSWGWEESSDGTEDTYMLDTQPAIYNN